MSTPGTDRRQPISENIIKPRFVTEFLSEEAEAIRAAQREVIEEYNQFKTVEL